jgi:two-component system NtrC family sensor kinase
VYLPRPVTDLEGGGDMNKTFLKDKKVRKKAELLIENVSSNTPELSSLDTHDIFRLLSEYSHDVIFLAHYQPEFSFDYVSESASLITGYSPEEFMADPLLPKKCIPKEDLHLLKDPTMSVTQPIMEPTALRWRRKDGRIIWTEHYVMINFDEKGQPDTCLIIVRDITEHKLAEESLQIEKNKLQSIIDAMGDSLTIHDKDFNIIFQNELARRFTGTSKIGEKCYKVHEGRDSVCENCPVALSFQDGQTHTSERRRVLPSGEIHYWETIANPVKDANGQVIICMEIARDISSRKRAEVALQESQKFVSSLLENAPHAIVVLNPDTSVRYVNPAWERLNGWTLGEVVGIKAPYPWWPDEYQEDFVPSFIQAINMPSGHGEVLAVKKNRETYWIDMNWVSVTHEGELQYTIINSVDVTERRRAEEQRQAILQTALDGFWICDRNGKFLEVNDSYCQMIGYTREELLKMSITDIEAVERPEQTAQRIKQIIEQGSDRFETQHRSKDGRIIDIEISVTYHNIGEGQLTVFVRDITHRKKTEKILADEATRRRILIEQSRDGIVILDQNGKVYEANHRFAEMLGYSPEEISQLSVCDWEYSYPPEQVLEMIRTVDEVGDHFETKHRRKDGSVYDVEISTNGATFAGQKLIFCVCRDISEHKEAEKALRESEEKFAAAFHSSPDMICITNLETGLYTDVNESMARSLEYSQQELVGRHPLELGLWVYPEEAENMMRLMQKERQIKQQEYHFHTKSGKIRTWLCSAEFIAIGGQPSMISVAIDITERKEIQEALRESEEKFSKAFHASPGSISISKISDSKFIEVNDSFLQDKGYTREEIVGHSSNEFNIWANPDDGIRLTKTLKEGGIIKNELMQYRTKSGLIRVGLVSAEIINIGNEPCMIVLNTDLTQQKQAEEQIRLLSSVTKQVSDSIIITDPNFRITYINQAAQDLFGYSIDEVRGKDLSMFNKSKSPEKTKQNIRTAISQGKLWNQIIAKKRKDGTVLICDCRLSPLYDEKGQTCSFIDVQRDITEQKNVEAKLKAQKQLIESILSTMPEGVLVTDSNDQIIMANESVHRIFHKKINSFKNKALKNVISVEPLTKMYNDVKLGKNDKNTLEFRYNTRGIDKIIDCAAIKMEGARVLFTFTDVSREREEEQKLYLTDRLASIGEMAAGLAHELNNPLTGILSLSQLLLYSDMPEESREDLENINSEAKRAANIVKNVLLFTRNNNYENGQASVNEVIRDVLRLREYEEKVNNMSIITNLQDNLADVKIDKYQLQQVFLNIILNAEAAIKDIQRPGQLTVTTERVNHHVNILFTDNGCGIKKHILPRIFDPFFTTKEIGKGTGLGLSICYGIVSKYGGKISVKTQVNVGTTFTVRLPVAAGK